MSHPSLSMFNIIISIILLYIRHCVSCPSGYSFCATENDICVATGNVAYGVASTWTYKQSAGAITCNNQVFGDVANGFYKMCCIQNRVVSPNPVQNNNMLSGTAIDGIWNDDFLIDPNQISGWYIYNNNAGPLENPLVIGNKIYHGKFSRINDGRQNFMQRYFKCSRDSNIYISYKFAYCATESTDKAKMVWISTTGTNEKENVMDSSSPSDISLSTIEGNKFNTALTPVSRSCDSNNEWSYQSIIEHFVGEVNAGLTWQLIFSQSFSSSIEYGLFFDIIINCDAINPNIPTQPPVTIPVITPGPEIPAPEIQPTPVVTSRAPTSAPTTKAPTTKAPTNNSHNNSQNNSENNSNNNSNNNSETPLQTPGTQTGNGNGTPNNNNNGNIAPSGQAIGAYGQYCLLPTYPNIHKCEFNTDIISGNAAVECTNAYECCMCEFIECNLCNILRIGNYGAYGVHDITVYGNDISGAIIECFGHESCRETAIIGTDINMILCTGNKACQNAIFTVDIMDLEFECTDFESCHNLQLDINIAGSIPPPGFACPIDPAPILFTHLWCTGEKSCENLQITINNKGCPTLVIESIFCATDSCNGCNINTNGNNIACDSIQSLTIKGLMNNNPIINIPPTTTITQQPLAIAPTAPKQYCCHTTMPAFELWNGYCLMLTSQSECDTVPNGRCEWKSNDCFPNPQCIMREEACTESNNCCSKVCLFQDAINGLGGVCR